MVIAVILICWTLTGALLGIYEARRGHWRWLWLMGAMAGPFSIPLYRQLQRNEVHAGPVQLSPGSPERGQGPRMLAGIDGSEQSLEAARAATHLFGTTLAGVTLAAVTDYEVNELVPGPLTPDEVWTSEHTRALEDAAEKLGGWLGFQPATVLLTGRPAAALQRYAGEGGFDVIVVGARGHGLTERLLGSCASQLTSGSPVPVVVMPAAGDRTHPAPGHDGASAPLS